jgi:hypothetical protein
VLVLNDVAEAIELGRSEVAAAAAEFLPDTCTIYTASSQTPDDFGDITDTDATSDSIPCSYDAINAYERSQAASFGAFATHTITLPATDVTLGITASSRIVVDARGTTPERTFQVTGRLDSAMSMLLRLAATLQD